MKIPINTTMRVRAIAIFMLTMPLLVAGTLLRPVACVAQPASSALPPSPSYPATDLSRYKTEDLIRWLDWTKTPENLKATGDLFEICDELLKRREVSKLVAALDTIAIGARRYLTGYILNNIDSPEVAKAFEARLSEKTEEADYYMAQYLAERGNRRALEILNRNYFQYPVSSMHWAVTAETFGAQGYRPAIPNLVDSLNAASLNLVSGASSALRLLYPDAPKKFKTLAECQAYFAARAEKEFGAVK